MRGASQEPVGKTGRNEGLTLQPAAWVVAAPGRGSAMGRSWPCPGRPCRPRRLRGSTGNPDTGFSPSGITSSAPRVHGGEDSVSGHRVAVQWVKPRLAVPRTIGSSLGCSTPIRFPEEGRQREARKTGTEQLLRRPGKKQEVRKGRDVGRPGGGTPARARATRGLAVTMETARPGRGCAGAPL